MEAECLCYSARGLDLARLHARDRRQIGTGHLNSAGFVLKETPVFLVFLWNKTTKKRNDITLKTITFTRTFKWSLFYLSEGQVFHVYVETSPHPQPFCKPTQLPSSPLLFNCCSVIFRVMCPACSPLSWWLTQASTAYQTRLALSFVSWKFLRDAGHFFRKKGSTAQVTFDGRGGCPWNDPTHCNM